MTLCQLECPKMQELIQLLNPPEMTVLSSLMTKFTNNYHHSRTLSTRNAAIN